MTGQSNPQQPEPLSGKDQEAADYLSAAIVDQNPLNAVELALRAASTFTQAQPLGKVYALEKALEVIQERITHPDMVLARAGQVFVESVGHPEIRENAAKIVEDNLHKSTNYSVEFHAVEVLCQYYEDDPVSLKKYTSKWADYIKSLLRNKEYLEPVMHTHRIMMSYLAPEELRIKATYLWIDSIQHLTMSEPEVALDMLRKANKRIYEHRNIPEDRAGHIKALVAEAAINVCAFTYGHNHYNAVMIASQYNGKDRNLHALIAELIDNHMQIYQTSPGQRGELIKEQERHFDMAAGKTPDKRKKPPPPPFFPSL